MKCEQCVTALPGRGKTHFLAAVGHELILRHQKRILFIPTFKLVQRLLEAKKRFELEMQLKKLDGFEAIILDDLGYVQPLTIRGRADLMDQFLGYGDTIRLHSADGLVVERSQDSRVVILEYDVHGKMLSTGVSYDNRLISVITIENRKIVHWRDYMDSLAAWTALNGNLVSATPSGA